MVFSIMGLLLLLLFVGVPLIAGVALVMRSRLGGKGYPACGACGYDVTGSVGNAVRCPECGAAFLEAGIVPPRGHARRGFLWLGICLIAIPLVLMGLVFISAWQARSAMQARQAATAAQLRAMTAPPQQVSPATVPATLPADE